LGVGQEVRAVSSVSTFALDGLKKDFKGEIVTPGDPAYDTRRRVWNGMIDRRPAAIARASGVADVAAAVNFARDSGALLAIRGGGHSAAGHGTCDGGLVLDLSLMKGVRVDPKRRTAWVQGGALWREVDRETQLHGLATVGGTVSDTGVAGLTLGGGLGWLMSQYGLTCDNLLSAEVVTAGGEAVRASQDENSDLFWALRGGGGNFGVVTGFEFKLHPVKQALFGLVVHPQSKAREVLKFYGEFAPGVPDDLSVFPGLLSLPDGTPVVALICGYFGDPAKGEKLLAPLRKFGQPIADTVGPVTYTHVQTGLEGGVPPGLNRYWKSSFTRQVNEKLIDALLGACLPLPTPLSAVFFFHVHGAASKVKQTDTAYPHRGQMWDMDFIGQWTDADKAKSPEYIAWVRRTFDAMKPFAPSEVYVNHLAEDEGDRVKGAYGANYDRLVQAKNRFDPKNMFRVNHNIRPTARG
jgi:hypothetical protein